MGPVLCFVMVLRSSEKERGVLVMGKDMSYSDKTEHYDDYQTDELKIYLFQYIIHKKTQTENGL